MKKDLIRRLARQAGFFFDSGVGARDLTDEGCLSRFAELVAEECARVVEAERLEGPATHLDDIGYQDAIRDAAAAIRAEFTASKPKK